MVGQEGLGVLRQFVKSVLGLLLLTAALTATAVQAQGTPLNQITLPDGSGRQVDLLTLLKQQKQLTPEQEAGLNNIKIPFTAADKAKVYLKMLRLPDDPFLTTKLTQKLNAMQSADPAEAESDKNENPKVLGIFRDQKSVDAPVELPHRTESPYINAPIPKLDPQKSNLVESIKYYDDQSPGDLKPEDQHLNRAEEEEENASDEAAITAPVLSRCTKSDTKRIKNDYRVEVGPKGNRFDALFIDAESSLAGKLKKEDELVLIGENTLLFPYSSEPGDLLSLQAIEYGATCLPFRIRVTDKFIFFHTGDDALLNYDRNPDGNGTSPKPRDNRVAADAESHR